MSSLQYVMLKNVAKLITGNLSAGLANGNNSTKEQSQSSRKWFTHQGQGDNDDDEILTISTIKVNAMEDTQHSIHNTCDEAFATLEITQPDKKQKINPQSKVDTGTHSNVLPIRLLCIIPSEKFNNKGNPKPETLEKNEAVLSAYGSSIIKQLGTINIPCKYKEKRINCIFYVTDPSGLAILILKACTALKLVSLHCTLRANQLDQAYPTNSFNISAQNWDTSKKSPNYIGSHAPLKERPPIRNKQELMALLDALTTICITSH